jgi:subtilisin family serine protease
MKKLLTVFVASLLLLTVFSIVAPYSQAEDKIPVIIGFNGKPDEKLVRSYRGEIKYTYDITAAIAAKIPERAIEALRSNKNIAFIEPDFRVQMDAIPNDARFDDLWGLHNIGQIGGTPDADIDATEVWDIQTGSTDVVIAVIDSGVDYNHEDLNTNMWINTGEIPGNLFDDDGNGYIDDVYGYDFAYSDSDPMDIHGHGTHCSGTIAGVGNNGIGVAGVNWDARIMALKFLDDSGSGWTSDAILAVQYATMMKLDYNVPVIATSNSWGGGGYSTTLVNAIAAADAAGILFIAAAGNDWMNTDQYPHYPSSYSNPNIISVAATDRNDGLADTYSWGSNYGATTVDLAAPGVSILSTTPNDSYSWYSGTSMATPHVSGVVALLKAEYPWMTHTEIRDTILNNVDPIPELSGKMVTGGRLNAFSTFQQTDQPISDAGPDQTAPDANNDLVETITLDGTGSFDPIGGGLTYSWILGGTEIGTTALVDHAFDIGTHTVILTVTDANTQTDSDSVVITVDLNSPPVADAGPDIELTDTDGDGVKDGSLDGSGSYDPDGVIESVIWSIGESEITFPHPFAVGTHTITLTVADNGGATDSDSAIVTILPKPPESVTLGIDDGYDEKSQRTLGELGVTSQVQSSDNIRWMTDNGFYTSYAFSDFSLPSGATIESVVISVEHYEDGGFKGGNLIWSVGTGWPSEPDVWGTLTAPLRVGKNVEGVNSWDVTSIIATTGNLDAMEFAVQNNDGRKNAYVDHLYAVVQFSVGPPNDSPIAFSKSVTTDEDSPIAITLQGDDLDGDALTYSIVSGPVHGVLSGMAPSVTYTPDTNIWGSDSFTFKVNDGMVDSNVATVTITITSIPDAPVPTADSQSLTTFVNTPTDIILTGSDPDGDHLTYSIVTGPVQGTISGTAPDLVYSPNADVTGFDSFTFTVNDGLSDSTVATVSIEIINAPAPDEMYVASIVPTLMIRRGGPNTFYHAEVEVLVVDAEGAPIPGVTVHGHWSGATGDIDTGTTSTGGLVVIISDNVKNPSPGTTFTFWIDDLVFPGWVYDPSGMTPVSISV